MRLNIIFYYGLLTFCGWLLLSVPIFTQADELQQIQLEGEKKLIRGQKSQKKIDSIVDSMQEKFVHYQSLLKQIEGLQIYNDQMSIQINHQEDLLALFDQSVHKIALIKRQILPLMIKMIENLERFIELDLPFHIEERQQRLASLNENLVAVDIDLAEKFRQVLEAYQIENEYGRKLDTYRDIVSVNGQQREVDVLRIGRIALICQTRDTKVSAYWDRQQKAWQILDNITYRNAIRNGIKMAKKQIPIDMLKVPIDVPKSIGTSVSGG